MLSYCSSCFTSNRAVVTKTHKVVVLDYNLRPKWEKKLQQRRSRCDVHLHRLAVNFNVSFSFFQIFVFQCFVFPILFMFTILKLGVVNMEIVVSNMETDKISLIRSLTRLLQIYHQVCYHNMANMFPLQNRVIISN